MATSTIKEPFKVKSTTKEITTNANGNASLGISLPNIVLSVANKAAGYRCIPYLVSNDWHITLCDSSTTSFNAVPSQATTLQIYYC